MSGSTIRRCGMSLFSITAMLRAPNAAAPRLSSKRTFDRPALFRSFLKAAKLSHIETLKLGLKRTAGRLQRGFYVARLDRS